MKIYEQYTNLKHNDNTKLYLFEIGYFYNFIDEDANYISSILNLKTSTFGKTCKCGFPIKSIKKYKSILDDLDVDYEVINNNKNKINKTNKTNQFENIIKYIEGIDIVNTTPIDAFKHLIELKKLING